MDAVIVVEVDEVHVDEQTHPAIDPTAGGASRLDIGYRGARCLYLDRTEHLLNR
jgi:hypothetical protein